MSVKTDNIQIGNNPTTSQNFVISQAADGTGKLARQSGVDIITWDAAGKVAFPNGETPVVSKLVSGTPIATTSGTSHDFTGIPSWVKRITVQLIGVSTNGVTGLLLQLGDSEGIENTGYLSNSTFTGATSGGTSSTAGIIIYYDNAARNPTGLIHFVKLDANTWVASGVTAPVAIAGYTYHTSGSKTLSGTLDRIRLTTVNGTDVFDAGSVNILYE